MPDDDVVRIEGPARAFLESAVMPGVLATVGRSGGPVTSAVWFGLEGDTIIVSTPADGTKANNVRRDERVSFIVDSKERPYCGVAIEGHARTVDDPELARWRSIAYRYVGDDVSPEMRQRIEFRPRTIIQLVPRRVRTWNIPGE
jgi:PPOX class probable F420-dependent enzyme